MDNQFNYYLDKEERLYEWSSDYFTRKRIVKIENTDISFLRPPRLLEHRSAGLGKWSNGSHKQSPWTNVFVSL
jgi:hypothetical protein